MSLKLVFGLLAIVFAVLSAVFYLTHGTGWALFLIGAVICLSGFIVVKPTT